jgi:lycopene cyclase domain-containing protein
VAEYTVLAGVAVMGVVALEVLWLRTGLFRRPAYGITMLIMFVGQLIVDGWLTKLSAPIVLYDEGSMTGLRLLWDIPLEDFLFGFALLTAVLLSWERAGAPAR